MFEENLARIRTHRNNIHRYRNLLRSKLSDLERHFIAREWPMKWLRSTL